MVSHPVGVHPTLTEEWHKMKRRDRLAFERGISGHHKNHSTSGSPSPPSNSAIVTLVIAILSRITCFIDLIRCKVRSIVSWFKFGRRGVGLFELFSFHGHSRFVDFPQIADLVAFIVIELW